jgi:hypothetical protein
MAFIRQLESGRWQAQIRLKNRRGESKTFKRKSDAREWGRRREIELRDNPGRQEAERHTLADLVDRYLDLEAPKLSKVKTRTTQATHLRWWRKRIGNVRLANLTPAILAEQRDRLRKHRSPGTTNRYLASLSYVLTLAVREWGWLDSSPMRKLLVASALAGAPPHCPGVESGEASPRTLREGR